MSSPTRSAERPTLPCACGATLTVYTGRIERPGGWALRGEYFACPRCEYAEELPEELLKRDEEAA